jgi:hypothetical protein
LKDNGGSVVERSYQFSSRKRGADCVKVLRQLPLDDIRVYVDPKGKVTVYFRIDNPTQELIWKLEGVMAQGEYLGSIPVDEIEKREWEQVYRGEGTRGFKSWNYSRSIYRKRKDI